MRPNAFALVIAEAFLGLAVLLPWTPENVRYTAAGALAGLVGGHLNGTKG